MKKTKKNLKLLFSATASVAVLGTTSAAIVSCGHKKAPDKKNSWGDFKAKAMAETAINIVTYANVQATGWDVSKTDDFSFKVNPAVGEDGSTVVAVIASASNNNFATFTATYSTDEEYIDTDWACTTQPDSGPTFDDFKTQAMMELAPSIVKNASVEATGWNKYNTDDFTFNVEPAVGTEGSTVVATIASTENSNTAVFTATYVDGQEYVVGDWACTTQPNKKPTFNDFKMKAMKEAAPSIVKNASNVKVTDWDTSVTADFTFYIEPAVGTENSTVVATIKSTSNKNVATFTATYVYGQEYLVSSWACTSKEAVTTWTKFLADARDAILRNKEEILFILEEINKVNPNSLSKEVRAALNTDLFRNTLKIKDQAEKVNPDTLTVSFVITFNLTTHLPGTMTLAATQHDEAPYTTDDYHVDGTSTTFHLWYDSARSYLQSIHNNKEYNILARKLLDLANSTNSPNLYTLKDDGDTLYAQLSNISGLKETEHKISFKVR